MQKFSTRWFRLLAFVALTFVATGCFQQAGETGFSTPISQSLPTDFPTPTDTEEPPANTPAPSTNVSTLGQGGADSTEDVGLLFPTEPIQIAQQPTQGVNPSDPLGQTATIEYLISSGQEFYVTATAIIAGATQTVAAEQTSTAQVFFQPTFTPSPTVGAGQIGVSTPLLPGQDCIHEVRAEDRNLYRISLRYGSTVRGIAQASGIANINLIRVGQTLTIPGCGTLGVTPPPTSTVPASATPLGTPAPVVTTAPVTGGRIHVVEQGETLFEISLLYGVLVADIAAANGIANINLIYIGQELVIP